jgi:hypothetical protein
MISRILSGNSCSLLGKYLYHHQTRKDTFLFIRGATVACTSELLSGPRRPLSRGANSVLEGHVEPEAQHTPPCWREGVPCWRGRETHVGGVGATYTSQCWGACYAGGAIYTSSTISPSLSFSSSTISLSHSFFSNTLSPAEDLLTASLPALPLLLSSTLSPSLSVTDTDHAVVQGEHHLSRSRRRQAVPSPSEDQQIERRHRRHADEGYIYIYI